MPTGSMTESPGAGARSRRDPIKVRPTPTLVPHLAPQGEILEEGGRVVGTFYLPGHSPRDLKYHVGRRTITLWSRKEGQEFQTILVLPRWVRPETFVLSHKNGVYEFLLEAHDPPGHAPASA